MNKVAFGISVFLASTSAQAIADPLPQFARDVTLHVLIHELAHALIRDFDIPILGNEENMADTFATLFIASNYNDEATRIIKNRARSWMVEDAEVDPSEYDFKSEHELDIRRAYNVSCLLYGQSPVDFTEIADWMAISEDDRSDCSDMGGEMFDDWSRVLEPHQMPNSEQSKNVEIIYGEGPLKDTIQESGVAEEVAEIMMMFNWPNKVTLHVDNCGGGAYWSRSDQTIYLCHDYVQRFIDQEVPAQAF